MTRAFRRALFALTAGLTASVATAQIVSTAPPSGPRLTLAELRDRYADRAGHIALIDGVEVYYKDEGKGPAILMVHGSESSLKTWDVIAARLTAHYRVIRYDIPPQGLSGPVSDAAAARIKPTDIAEKLLERLGVRKITFVGVSSGGTLGVFLAAKRPDLVDRLILSNTPSDPVSTAHLDTPPALLAAQKEATEINFKSQNFWNEFLSFFSGRPTRITPQIRREYYDFGRRVPEKNVIALVARVADHAAAVDAMRRVRAPTLLLWGGADPLLPPTAADTIASYLTSAQVSKVIMPDVGHYPPLESPERFAQILIAYIESATPIGRSD
jgi:pimeloyl-ACP methyl ester carboxylesterase